MGEIEVGRLTEPKCLLYSSKQGSTQESVTGDMNLENDV
jgi:hypothetical protein